MAAVERNVDEELRAAVLRLADAQRAYADAYGAWHATGARDTARRIEVMAAADRRVEAAWRDVLVCETRR